MAVPPPVTHPPTLNQTDHSIWGSLPPIVDEKLVTLFRYWDEELRSGMRYQDDLYTLFAAYPLEQRLRASAIGCEQMERGLAVCITVSKTTYSVWLSLRSLNTAPT